MKNYKELFGQPNETWLQAIDRFKSFCETDMNDYFDKEFSSKFSSNPAYTYHREGKMTVEYLDNFAKKHATNIPDSLINLLALHGAFNIGDTIFEIFDSRKGIMTLDQILKEYKYDTLAKEMGAGMLDSMNEYYFFFGVTFPQTDEASFLFFNKAGSCGKMHIDNTNHDQVLKKTFPSMFNGSIDKYTVDSLISNQLDRVITNALKVKNYIK